MTGCNPPEVHVLTDGAVLSTFALVWEMSL